MKQYLSFVLIVLSSFIFSGCNQNIVVNNSGSSPTQTPQTSPVSQKSLKDILALGIAQKCTYTYNNEGVEMKGDVLVSGTKFKQTTQMKVDQGNIDSYAVSDGAWMYTWTSQFKGTGMKMKIDELDTAGSDPKTSKVDTQKFDINQKMDYSCTPVVLKDSDFDLPKDIKFTDLTETIKQFQNGFDPNNAKRLDLDQFKGILPSGN